MLVESLTGFAEYCRNQGMEISTPELMDCIAAAEAANLRSIAALK